MRYLDFFSCLIGTIVFIFSIITSYYKTLNKEIKRFSDNISKLMILLFGIVVTLINMYLESSYRWIFIIVLLVLTFKIIFREKIGITIAKALIFYLIVILCDLIIGVSVMIIPNASKLIEGTSVLRAVCTFLTGVMYYLIFLIKPLCKLLQKLFVFLQEKVKYIFGVILIIGVITFFTITYSYITEGGIKYYILTVLIFGFLLMLCITLCVQFIKNKNKEKEQEILLNTMNQYEIILDKDRENRHEMLNNLLVLKSFKNKGSKEFEKILQDIINEYQNKKTSTYSELYKLPSGIKGIVYYKLNNIIDSDIKFKTLITKESYERIESLETESYYNVCKILGILLDNAIEACEESDDKEILIDIYNEEKMTNIYIENTYRGKINIDEINKKGYSTKGKNRGLGLNIVNLLIKKNNYLDLKQYIYKDRFISNLIIK